MKELKSFSNVLTPSLARIVFAERIWPGLGLTGRKAFERAYKAWIKTFRYD